MESFTCGQIMIDGHNSSDHNIRSDLQVKVEITEQPPKILSNENIQLHLVERIAVMPQLLLIPPRFIYTIYVGNFFGRTCVVCP